MEKVKKALSPMPGAIIMGTFGKIAKSMVPKNETRQVTTTRLCLSMPA